MTSRGRSAFVALLALQAGCYQYSALPVERPVPATVVEVTLNDHGRMAMEGHIGPDALTVEGNVADVSDSGFTLRVRKVTTINREVTAWSGEPVRFESMDVRFVRARQFSAGRTVLMAGSMAAGAVAMAATGTLIGRAIGDHGGPTPGDPNGGNGN